MKQEKTENLYSTPFLRHCQIASIKPNIAALKTAILCGEETQSDFVLLDAPIPPLDQTRFAWAGDDRVLLLGVAFPHSAHAPLYPDDLESETLELLFDLHNDGIGRQQLVFGSDGGYVEYSHLPYSEAHSSAFPLLKPKKWQTEIGQFGKYLGGMGCRWFWVWFDAGEVFRHGESVGFNLCRTRATGEYSAWNYPSGNGAPDATGFGVLNRAAATVPQSARRQSFRAAPSFTLATTYDSPDNLVYSPLSPEKLTAEFELMKGWGISRLHWIDYSDAEAMWSHPAWRENTQKTLKEVGDLTRCAATQAHAAGLEFIADFKVFDLGINCFINNEKILGVTPDIEGFPVTAIPEIAAHPEWTLQAHPSRQTEYSVPAATLRFFSDEPIREIKASQIKLLVSDDNRKFKPYRGKVKVRQGVLQRPHQRWTPHGPEREKGSARNWFIELAGLKLSTRFAALQIEGEPAHLCQRGFMVAEVEDDKGNRIQHTVATQDKGKAAHPRFSFWKEWPGWSNITEPILARRRWNANSFGIALREIPNMPTMLEPTYEGARQIWLSRIAKLFDAGADGVNLRIFNHHNGVLSYLQYAFAPIVLEEFQSCFGREPQSTPEDFERLRTIRGAAFTQFVRDAKKLADARCKKLTTQLESGIEVPPHFDTRMQLHIDWQTWIKEGLVEEAHLKFFSPYNRFVHQKVIPLARKHELPVHVVSRNLSGIINSPRALETIPRQVADARRLGFSGFNYYEANDLYERNSAGGIWTKGLANPALTRVREDLKM